MVSRSVGSRESFVTTTGTDVDARAGDSVATRVLASGTRSDGAKRRLKTRSAPPTRCVAHPDRVSWVNARHRSRTPRKATASPRG
jgi:hypothetical protein